MKIIEKDINYSAFSIIINSIEEFKDLWANCNHECLSSLDIQRHVCYLQDKCSEVNSKLKSKLETSNKDSLLKIQNILKIYQNASPNVQYKILQLAIKQKSFCDKKCNAIDKQLIAQEISKIYDTLSNQEILEAHKMIRYIASLKQHSPIDILLVEFLEMRNELNTHKQKLEQHFPQKKHLITAELQAAQTQCEIIGDFILSNSEI